MAGGLPAESEIVGRIDDGAAEEFLPEAIHDDARSERVAGGHQPFGKIESRGLGVRAEIILFARPRRGGEGQGEGGDWSNGQPLELMFARTILRPADYFLR